MARARAQQIGTRIQFPGSLADKAIGKPILVPILVPIFECEPDELVELRRRLGQEPKTMIDIHISSTEGSLSLAKELLAEIVSRWGGEVDDSGMY